MKKTLFVLIVALMVVGFISCEMPTDLDVEDYERQTDNNEDEDSGEEEATYTNEHTIEYIVEGTSAYMITINNKDDNIQQWSEVSLPWSHSFETNDLRSFMYVSAQNYGEGSSITVKLLIDGEVVEENTSFGDYVIATVSR